MRQRPIHLHTGRPKSLRLTLLWWIGFALRYCVLFPLRLIIFIIGIVFLILGTAIVGSVPDGSWKRSLNRTVSLISYRTVSLSMSAVITYHNEEYMGRSNGICVANHTSPIDAVVLSCGNCYALVGQKHGGILGLVQRALNRASSHIWFERTEANDRSAVSRRDGQLKRFPVKKELREKQQERYSRRISGSGVNLAMLANRFSNDSPTEPNIPETSGFGGADTGAKMNISNGLEIY